MPELQSPLVATLPGGPAAAVPSAFGHTAASHAKTRPKLNNVSQPGHASTGGGRADTADGSGGAAANHNSSNIAGPHATTPSGAYNARTGWQIGSDAEAHLRCRSALLDARDRDGARPTRIRVSTAAQVFLRGHKHLIAPPPPLQAGASSASLGLRVDASGNGGGGGGPRVDPADVHGAAAGSVG